MTGQCTRDFGTMWRCATNPQESRLTLLIYLHYEPAKPSFLRSLMNFHVNFHRACFTEEDSGPYEMCREYEDELDISRKMISRYMVFKLEMCIAEGGSLAL